ncbi:hypothetical protein LCGC14_1375900 [marine sediment metagenome]|uniref:Uncharacterized protein n=1 Tax=marine sediment metagenome TaxID=412755 RepID=A0A0F9K453_9ZZZZ
MRRNTIFIGLLHANKKSKKDGKCRQCQKPIRAGELHALVMTRFGKVQDLIRGLRVTQESKKRDKYEEPTGRPIGKKEGLRYSRIHMTCLAIWMIGYYTRKSEWRREHRKGGRPTGTGALSQLTVEEKLTRRRLVRRRAELLRKITKEEDKELLLKLARKLKDVEGQMDIPVAEKLARRHPEAIKQLRRKDQIIRSYSIA